MRADICLQWLVTEWYNSVQARAEVLSYVTALLSKVIKVFMILVIFIPYFWGFFPRKHLKNQRTEYHIQ